MPTTGSEDHLVDQELTNRLSYTHYDFYVHITRPRWRLVLGQGAQFPSETTADEWIQTRVRVADDTNPDVRLEVQKQGFCLFAISSTFAQMRRDGG